MIRKTFILEQLDDKPTFSVSQVPAGPGPDYLWIRKRGDFFQVDFETPDDRVDSYESLPEAASEIIKHMLQQAEGFTPPPDLITDHGYINWHEKDSCQYSWRVEGERTYCNKSQDAHKRTNYWVLEDKR